LQQVAYYEADAYPDADEATQCQEAASGYGCVKLGCTDYTTLEFVLYSDDECLYVATDTIYGVDLLIPSFDLSTFVLQAFTYFLSKCTRFSYFCVIVHPP